VKVLVISDTHIPVVANELPAVIIEQAKKSNCCIHAGDFTNREVLKNLESLTKIYAVSGNMDNPDICKQLPEKAIIELEGVRAGIIHGRGAPANLIDNYIKREFSDELKKIDIIIFGHTHYPTDKIVEEKIYFNPGSPTDTVFAPYRSYGILEIEGKNIKRRIIKIE
jgi:putative phosphoesterase